MSEAQKQALVWLGIILLISYVLAINPVSIIGGVVHGVQQMHQTNTQH
jgi:hypothetical protein